MPYIYVTFGGKKISGGYIKIDGDSQICLFDEQIIYLTEGSHCIQYSSTPTFSRVANQANLLFGNRVGATMAAYNESNSIDGEISEYFPENGLMTLEVISDSSGKILSLPKYVIRELDDEELEEVNGLYSEQCANIKAYEEDTSVTELLLCLFLGTLGIHKFYRRQFGMGVLYLLTFGLFGIGVIVDLIKIIIKLCKKGKRTV